MKKDSKIPFFLPGAVRRRRAGMALIIILSCLVLITGVIVAFFSSVSTELNAAKGYANGVTTKELADTTLAAVMGTIKTATSGSLAGVSWASQPGMIRTYDTSSSGTNGLAFYKLYSSNKMVIGQPDMPFHPADDVDTNWSSLTALYTDLNAPVVSGSSLVYPIMDPAADGVIEGFKIDSARPGYTASLPSGPTNDPAPMPVKWLYVLKDGSFTAPAGGNDTATWMGASGIAPSKSNPIVGRVAFWTDDETCKLNINTASEATPWDTPRAVSGKDQDDVKYGTYQPAYHEYQRFPGHPAMTSLSPVLYPNQTIGVTEKTKIYQMIPRIEQGGSVSATQPTVSATTGVACDHDRLFASVDEMLFKPSSRSVDQTIFSSSTLSQLHAFLTANSRAPELNLYGGPRISMWPVSNNASLRTSFDKASAFCATIGNPSTSTSGATRPFYFARNPMSKTTGAASTTDDYKNISRNQALYAYLQQLTNQDVPGFGGNFKAKWANDRDQILTEIFDYIRCTNLHDPTIGSAQYASQTYDSITDSNGNTWSTSGDGQVAPIKITTNGQTTMGFGRFHTISQFGILFICSYDYNAITTVSNVHNAGTIFRSYDFQVWERDYRNTFNTGFPAPTAGYTDGLPTGNDVINGRDATINGVHCHIDPFFNYNGGHGLPGTIPHPGFSPANKYAPLIGKKLIQTAILFEPFSPSVGWFRLNNDNYYDFSLSGFSLLVTGTAAAGTPVPLFSNVPQKVKYHPDQFWSGFHGRQWGGSQGIRLGRGWNPLVDNTYSGVPGVSGIAIGTGDSLVFNGGTITVNVYTGPDPANGTNGQTIASSPPDQLVQTINATMPVGAIPQPTFITSGVTSWNAQGAQWGGVSTSTPRAPTTQPAAPAKPIPVPQGRSDCSDPALWWNFGNWYDFSFGHEDGDNGMKAGSDTASAAGGAFWYGRFTAAGSSPCAPGSEYTDPNRRWFSSGPGWTTGCVFREEDVVRTIVPKHGDLRLIAALPTVPATLWVKADATHYADPSYHIVQLFTEAVGPHVLYNFANEPSVSGSFGTHPGGDTQLVKYDYHYSRLAEIVAGAGLTYNQYSDWDNGPAQIQDGPYINKPDEGNVQTTGGVVYPYFSWDFKEPTQYLFSGNRIVPSSMMLGSLPTGVIRDNGTGNYAWQTLLFHPPTHRDGTPATTTGSIHPGWVDPKDHLIADLFWMPMVEPYPISEPFSTAGKVNMNYQIVPFHYITRSTAMRGVLKSEEPLAISTDPGVLGGGMSIARIAKLWDTETNCGSLPSTTSCLDAAVRANWNNYFYNDSQKIRYPIDPVETLQQFDDQFQGNNGLTPNIFKSATQICEMHMVRQAEHLTDYKANFWTNYLATGDNTRERPYANLYARLTTKSNTYTVHMKVQALQQTIPPGTPAGNSRWTQWKEGTDRVLGEYRGSALIERYVDPMDPALANFDESYVGGTQFDANGNVVHTSSIDPFYRFRVLSVKKVGP